MSRSIGVAVGRASRLSALCILVLSTAAGCDRAMHEQPLHRPLERSVVFADENSSRPLIPGTVARGEVLDNRTLRSGLTGVEERATEFPMPVTASMIERGRERFQIFCTPCHGADGGGNGLVVARGFPPPPSLLELTGREPGLYVDAIANGYGIMFPYRDKIDPADRWAVAAWIMLLNGTEHHALHQISAAERARLRERLP
jgi:mono/diheme cytochrome c family protein